MTRALENALLGVALGEPGGRLTLTTGTPVMTAEAANQTTIYYTPYKHDRIPLYNGTEWAMREFTELSIAMAGSANWAASTNYDLYVYDDAGTIRLVTGAAWTNDTTRSESLTRVNGIWTNNASMTGRYGAASTVSIGANLATYVGTMRTTASTGTTTWELGGSAAGGDPGQLYLWNAYHRKVVAIRVHDSTSSWTYATGATWREANNSSNTNAVNYVVGLGEDGFNAAYEINAYNSAVSNTVIGIGVDSTSASSGANGLTAETTYAQGIVATWAGNPGIGKHTVTAIERVAAGTGNFLSNTDAERIGGMHFVGMF